LSQDQSVQHSAPGQLPGIKQSLPAQDSGPQGKQHSQQASYYPTTIYLTQGDDHLLEIDDPGEPVDHGEAKNCAQDEPPPARPLQRLNALGKE